MLKTLAKGILGRLLAYGVFVLGFWLLYRAFQDPNIVLGILGGVMILGAMYLLVTSYRMRLGGEDRDSSRSEEDSK